MRVAGVYRIKPELLSEYKGDHDAIWPELKAAIHEAGIKNYSIFHYRDGLLFSYFETDLGQAALETRIASLAEQEIKHKWETAMKKYFVKINETGEGPAIEGLEEVFHLD
jgi:L-rhamnose mutarotase